MRLELVEQLGVRLGVHFATQDLFGALHGQHGHFGAQCFTRALDFLGGVLAGLGDDPGLFGFGFAAGFVDQRGGLLFGFGKTRVVFRFGGGFHQTDAGLGLGQIGLALFGGGQTVGDHVLDTSVQARLAGLRDTLAA